MVVKTDDLMMGVGLVFVATVSLSVVMARAFGFYVLDKIKGK